MRSLLAGTVGLRERASTAIGNMDYSDQFDSIGYDTYMHVLDGFPGNDDASSVCSHISNSSSRSYSGMFILLISDTDNPLML